jgi:hypothetical protein
MTEDKSEDEERKVKSEKQDGHGVPCPYGSRRMRISSAAA